MRRRERIYPPNCTVCDLNPSRFLAFREKQRQVEAEYGFRLCVPRRTEEQRDGYRRYMRDYQRRYRDAHREERKTYRHAYWVNVTKRGFDNLAEANGDEEALKRKAAKKEAARKRAEYEARKKEIHDKYGFWLNTPPRTPEEAAGRARYRKEQDAARKERNRDKIAAYQKEHNAKRREERERKFQAKLKRIEAKDPVAAEKFKAKHEKLVRIQHMTHEERVRYRQQKQFERLQEQERRRVERQKAREEAAKNRNGHANAQKPAKMRLTRAERLKALKLARQEKERRERERLRLEREEFRRRREAQAAALVEAEKNAVATFAAEREENRKRYLAAKAAAGKRDVEREEEAPVSPAAPAPSVPAINIADYLPHHPFRGLLLEDTAPTDDEIAGEASIPGYADYAKEDDAVPAAGGGSTPIDPPSNNNTTTGGSEEDDNDWRRREREEKIRRIREKYGFTLGVKPVTPEEIEGKKRYVADRNRETAIRNREIDFMLHGKERIRKAAAKKRKATIARKKREAAAQAAREAKAAERAAQTKAREEARLAAAEAKRAAMAAEAAAKAERAALLEQAYKSFGYKVTAYERKKEKMRRQLGLPKMKRDFTPEQRGQWNAYILKSRKELEDWLVERMRKELAGAPKSIRGSAQDRPPPAEVVARREAKKKRKQEIFEKYGFTLGKKPVTPDEIEGFKRWQRDQEAEYRERHRDRITEYNREYRRRRRAEALAKAQAKWTPEQWAAWEKKQAKKERGSPAWLVKEVVKHLAAEHGLSENQVTERLLELGGLDFLVQGAESMGAKRCRGKATVRAAARALALYLDPDNAEMFGEREEKRTESETGDKEQQSKENAS